MDALLFDCDGVLADTERDGHRVAFNHAFAAEGLSTHWSIERYGALLGTAGGKERMTREFVENGWPVPAEGRVDLVAALHRRKTRMFMDIVQGGSLPLRPGVQRLIDEAVAAGLKVAVCSTSNEKAVQAVVDQLGPELAGRIRVFAGDIVAKKKPDPAIYLHAAMALGVEAARCVVIEDTSIGLRAARAAGMACIVTTSSYTAAEDFSGAARVVSGLGGDGDVKVTLAHCRLAADGSAAQQSTQ